MKKDEGEKIITFCLIGNFLLLLLKGSVGLLAGSQALQADAVNSAGDVLSSIVVLFGVRFSLKPHDEGHPYGHGKMEALVSFIVGMLVLVSVVLLFREAVTTIMDKSVSSPSFYALGAALLSIAVKSVMYVKTRAVGKRLSSIAVTTNAKDHRNDIFATSGTVIAILLSFVGQNFKVDALYYYAEPAVAMVMSIFIVKTAVEILTEASRMLLDAAPDKETVNTIRETVCGTEGVEKLNWAKCRKMGRGLLVDVAIEVDSGISVVAGHGIGDNVKFAIMGKLPQVLDVVVHINPDRK